MYSFEAYGTENLEHTTSTTIFMHQEMEANIIIPKRK